MEIESGSGLATALAAAVAAAARAGALAAAPAARRRAERETGQAAAGAALSRQRHDLRVPPHVATGAVPDLDSEWPRHGRGGVLVGLHRPSCQKCRHVRRHAAGHRRQLECPDEGLVHIALADGEDLRVGLALQELVHLDLLPRVQHVGDALEEVRVRPLLERREEDIEVDAGAVAILDVQGAPLQDRVHGVHRPLDDVDPHGLELVRRPPLQLRGVRGAQHTSVPRQDHNLFVRVLDADVTGNLEADGTASGDHHLPGLPDGAPRPLDLLLALRERLPGRGVEQRDLEAGGDDEGPVGDGPATRADEHLPVGVHLLGHLDQVRHAGLLVLLRPHAEELVVSLRFGQKVGGAHGPLQETAAHDHGDAARGLDGLLEVIHEAEASPDDDDTRLLRHASRDGADGGGLWDSNEPRMQTA
mmetsp:Transcript_99819/g.310378  ORF Transcript_99819/g.310378 Transcript_99819/m.310378 type:complete len:417 (+) Transcript_99819:161-1411(+)